MKMRFFNRLMLALYALVWLVVLAAIAAAVLLPGTFEPVLDLARSALEAFPFLPYVLVGVMALWSLAIFALAFKRDRRGEKGNVALQNTENGAVNIAVGALETMVQEAIGRNDEVLELKSQVVNHEDSITVQVRMVLSSSAHIPNVTMLMQRNIKRFIEEFSGIAVREVVITVTEVRLPEPAAKKRGVKNGKAPESIMAPANPLPEPGEAASPAASTRTPEPVSLPVEPEAASPAASAPAPEPVSLPVEPEAASPAEPAAPSAWQADEPAGAQVPEEPEEAREPETAGGEPSLEEVSEECAAQNDPQEDDGHAPA